MIRRKRSVGGTLDETLYVLKDYLNPAAPLQPGSPTAVVERFGLDAFGPVRFMNSSFGGISNSAYDWNFHFHVEFMDQESGPHNYGYKYYHPGLGRSITQMPYMKDREEINRLHNYHLSPIVFKKLSHSFITYGSRERCCPDKPLKIVLATTYQNDMSQGSPLISRQASSMKESATKRAASFGRISRCKST